MRCSQCKVMPLRSRSDLRTELHPVKHGVAETIASRTVYVVAGAGMMGAQVVMS